MHMQTCELKLRRWLQPGIHVMNTRVSPSYSAPLYIQFTNFKLTNTPSVLDELERYSMLLPLMRNQRRRHLVLSSPVGQTIVGLAHRAVRRQIRHLTWEGTKRGVSQCTIVSLTA